MVKLINIEGEKGYLWVFLGNSAVAGYEQGF